jgi:hypothetical protein
MIGIFTLLYLPEDTQNFEMPDDPCVISHPPFAKKSFLKTSPKCYDAVLKDEGQDRCPK